MDIQDIKTMIIEMRYMGFNELIIGFFVREARYCMSIEEESIIDLNIISFSMNNKEEVYYV